MAKTWGYIYGEKYEDAIRKYLLQSYKIDLDSIKP